MENHDTQFDEMRRQWQSMQLDNERLRKANERLTEELSAKRVSDRKHRLANDYRMLGWIALFLMPFLALLLPEQLDAPLWPGAPYGGVGIVMGIIDLCFARFVDKTDYISMPVCDAIVHAQRVLLWQARLRSVGICLAAIVLVPLFFHIDSMGMRSVMYGAIAGLIIGLVLGLRFYYSKRRAARKILEDLELK